VKRLSPVLVNLQNPREKFWGVLMSIQASGLTVCGIDLNSFEDWSRSVARAETEMGLSTVFFPIHRVERVNKDETIGGAQSLADIFEARTGTDIWTHLGLTPGLPSGEPQVAQSSGSEWMTLDQAELDYIERVLEDCEWDRSAAARILDISEDDLSDKLDAAN
jgi:hypothetical protein